MTHNYGSSEAEHNDTPIIVHHPARLGGKATIGHSRLPATLVADTYWHHGLAEVQGQWDYLSAKDVVVCCWYVATYGTASQRKRWKQWVDGAHDKLSFPRQFPDVELPPIKEPTK